MAKQPVLLVFETDQEQRYFSLFADRIASEICPYFDSGDWSRMILQACTAESSIRHAASAIGALGKAYEIAQAGRQSSKHRKEFDRLPAPGVAATSRVEEVGLSEELPGEVDLVQTAYTHHRHALEQYDKAIKRMRGDIASGNQSMRTTLIICIIITCFEAIHGHHESAAAQLLSGLALIQDWKGRQREADKHPQGFSSPAPDAVDDFLVQTFGRMEIHCMSVFDPRPVVVHDTLKNEGQDVIQQMPTTFTSISQARVYLDLIQRRLMHFTRSINDRPTSKPVTPTTSPSSASSLPTPGTSPASSASPPHPSPPAPQPRHRPMPWIDGKHAKEAPPSSPALFNEQTSLNNELAFWTSAFAPLLSSSLTTTTTAPQDAISALTLTISSLAAQISLRAAFFTNESSYDTFLPQFSLINTHARSLLQMQSTLDKARHTRETKGGTRYSTGEGMRFAFDIGVVPALYLVAVKCRDRRVRREAMVLLERYPRREGVWDSVATAAIAKWVVRLEEDGARRLSKAERQAESEVLGHGNGYGSPGGSPGWSNSGRSGAGTANTHGHRDGDVGMDAVTFIPELARVRKASMRFDLTQRKAFMHCLQVDWITGELVPRNVVFTW